MSHQVYFHETWLILLPVSKGSYGYRALEQASRPSGADSPSSSYLPAGLEQPIDGGWTDPTELHFCRGINLLLTMLPEYSYHLWYEWL